MNFLIVFISILLPLVFLAAVVCYGIDFFSDKKFAEAFKAPLLVSAIFLHIILFFIKVQTTGYAPIETLFDIMSLIALAIGLTYLYIENATKVKDTGFFVLLPAVFFQSIAAIAIGETAHHNLMLKNPILAFHIVSALLGYSAIVISGIYSFLYLLLFQDIKKNRFSLIFQRLPDLEAMELMSSKAVVFGFVTLTLAIIAGYIWIPQAGITVSYLDAKLIGTSLVWFIYGGGLLVKKVLGWQGLRMAWLSILGFVFAMFSLTFINLFSTKFHGFY